jgi:hypothetical protein
MIKRRASRSDGIPWGVGGISGDDEEALCVWIGVMPLLDARMTSGASGDSNARVKKVNDSRSNM